MKFFGVEVSTQRLLRARNRLAYAVVWSFIAYLGIGTLMVAVLHWHWAGTVLLLFAGLILWVLVPGLVYVSIFAFVSEREERARAIFEPQGEKA